MAGARKSGGKKKVEATAPSGKQSFDIEAAMRRLREATAPYPKAALFELYAEGHTSVFEILVACIISIRTRDETTLPVARRSAAWSYLIDLRLLAITRSSTNRGRSLPAQARIFARR